MRSVATAAARSTKCAARSTDCRLYICLCCIIEPRRRPLERQRRAVQCSDRKLLFGGSGTTFHRAQACLVLSCHL